MTYASSIEIPGAPISAGEGLDETDLQESIKTKFGAHHLLWLNCLQQVEDGSIKRLMGFFPPGSGKSIYTSVVYPTHYLGRFAKRTAILVSYGSDLPRRFGRRARSIVQQKSYKRIFDCSLSAESAAVDEWGLTNGSEWIANGILTGITGNRADVVIWDDPIKGREQAESEVIRQKTWDAYMDDLLTRKKPNAAEIGITTRWHEDDPAGRILPLNYNGESGWLRGRDGNDWYVVNLPAEAERADDLLGREVGEILWPEWFSVEHFRPFKLNPRTWSSLFQQRPAPESGDYFKAEWLKPYLKLPPRDTLRIYGASDYAVTKDGGDYTVHVVVGIDPEDNIYLMDLWRGQTGSDEWVEKFCEFVDTYRPMGWAEEKGQIAASMGPYIIKRLRERKLYVVRAQFPTRGDKAVRAQSIRARMSMNGLYVPMHLNWYSSLKSELMMFPNGKNDDQVDALGLIGQVLDKMISGSPLTPDQEKPKVFSTDPRTCTVTLDDMWKANDRSRSKNKLRIV